LLIANKWLPDLTDGSMWYHADYVDPWWARVKHRTMQIDQHIFYK
jgi:spore germination cell wall hydrolase CwlJ-like protein